MRATTTPPDLGRGHLDRKWRWLPTLAPQLALRVPEPVAKGRPTSSYPFSWAIYGWIDGQPHADVLVDDERQAAEELARFVAELRRIDPVGAPRGGREPLRELDADTRAAIESARGVIDGDAAVAVDDGTWERARGFALHQAALIIPYYAEANPGFVAPARRTVEEILADSGA